MYRWLVCHLLVRSDAKLQAELRKGKVHTLPLWVQVHMWCVLLSTCTVCAQDPFTARNDSQVYYLRSLAIAFIEVGHCALLAAVVARRNNDRFHSSNYMYTYLYACATDILYV